MYSACMAVALQVRDVPEPIRDVLAAQAAAEGRSLQSFLLDLLTREAQAWQNVALMREIEDSMAGLPEVGDAAALIAQDRTEREAELDRRSSAR